MNELNCTNVMLIKFKCSNLFCHYTLLLYDKNCHFKDIDMFLISSVYVALLSFCLVAALYIPWHIQYIPGLTNGYSTSKTWSVLQPFLIGAFMRLVSLHTGDLWDHVSLINIFLIAGDPCALHFSIWHWVVPWRRLSAPDSSHPLCVTLPSPSLQIGYWHQSTDTTKFTFKIVFLL